jgi:ACS family hexuronate transporter-like MFS transporter
MAFAQGFISAWWSGGQAFAQLLTPMIMMHLGWQYAYVIFGVIVLVFVYCWDRWCYNTPAEDPEVTPAEKAVIEEAKGNVSSQAICRRL